MYPPIGDTALVPFYVDSLRYAVTVPTGEFQYIAVAQQYGPNVRADWRSVGQYDLDSNLSVPSSIRVPLNDTLRNVDISVDFSKPPPQPF